MTNRRSDLWRDAGQPLIWGLALSAAIIGLTVLAAWLSGGIAHA